ncbi:hypothetical protein HNR42_003151 [Deinobacterium chartae]|uniref:DUF4180 domain-containing protein n=1 Tax=Deinobacterium chartae TaxID=521158 RepID=A0A841I335_9DEIO|nr:DUF4180 domain-containing protein [Deinobacterium chartae]MBB6099693.1 hypothetical protein [Deinobacterium chartae]
MNHRIVQVGDQTYIEVTSSGTSLATEQDALDLIALSWEKGIPLLLLHRDVFTDAFFQLRSGVAGAVLQKFSNYNLKVAAIIPDRSSQHARFQELVGETSRGRTFAVFDARAAAEAWLLG